MTDGSGVEPETGRGHLSRALAPPGDSTNLRLHSAPLRLSSASARVLGLGSLRLRSEASRLAPVPLRPALVFSGSVLFGSLRETLVSASAPLRRSSAAARPLGLGPLRLRSAAARKGAHGAATVGSTDGYGAAAGI